mgnify:CR=1 FL=1
MSRHSSRHSPPVQNGANHTPVGVAQPQVILRLVNNQVQLGSNIAPGPQTWHIITEMCLQGAIAAVKEMGKEAVQQDRPRIVVPTLQVKGGLAG